MISTTHLYIFLKVTAHSLSLSLIQRLGVPDDGGVVVDRAVGREDACVGNVYKRHSAPLVTLHIQLACLILRGTVVGKIGKGHIIVAVAECI